MQEKTKNALKTREIVQFGATFHQKLERKRMQRERRGVPRKRTPEEETIFQLNIVFLHEGPHKGAGLIQREEEERMRYGKRKKKKTVRNQCCLISIFWCCLSLHCP